MPAKIRLGWVSLISAIDQGFSLFGYSVCGMLRQAGKDVAKSELTLEEIEGDSEEIMEGIFALKTCPFSDAINDYKIAKGKLPDSINAIAEFENKKGEAWVSAFCAIHQSLRKERGTENYHHIACKSASEKVNIANQDILPRDRIDEIMENYVCIYRR
ncbi:MAG: hypothetical protein ACE5K0_09375 [Candidatus Methanofastidiosia archaeon]